MLGFEVESVVPVGKEDIVVGEYAKRQVGAVALFGVRDHVSDVIQWLTSVKYPSNRNTLPAGAELAPTRDAVDVAGDLNGWEGPQLAQGKPKRLTHRPRDLEVPVSGCRVVWNASGMKDREVPNQVLAGR